jgi:hypothetical protein
MMEMPSYNNTWAEKLEEVSMPDAGEAWKDMERILDKEMPTGRKKGRKPWLLFLLLLLLIAAFYFYPRHNSSVPMTPSRPSAKAGPSAASPHGPAAKQREGPGQRVDSVSGSLQPADLSSRSLPGAGPAGDRPGIGPVSGNRPDGGPAVSGSPVIAKSVPGKSLSPESADPGSAGSRPVSPAPPATRKGFHPPASLSPRSARRYPPTRMPGNFDRSGNPDRSGIPGNLRGTAAEKQQEMAKRLLRRSEPGKVQVVAGRVGEITARTPLLLAGADSLSGSKAKKDAKSPRKGAPQKKWEFGIGFNQSLATGNQQVWHSQSGGFNKPLEDYIPVPSVRYYFNQRLYLQGEARIHAPQYTRKDLEFLYVIPDTFNTAQIIGPISIKKLFYFQLPISIHYSPFHNWSLGLGLQYSRFNSGITYSDDTIGSRAEPVKDYPNVHIKSFEFRGLASVDYSFSKWTLGISYDAAFTRFIDYRLNGPYLVAPPVQGRNNSIQLSLRYYFLDGRKKKKGPLFTK